MRIITGRTGQPHITPEDDAVWHQDFQKVPTYFFKKYGDVFNCEVIDNSTVRINSGYLSLQGRFMCINKGEWDDVPIDPAELGMLRKDIIVAKLEIDDSGMSTASTVVIKGEESSSDPVAPIVPETDLDDGDNIAYVGLATVDISGANITGATTMVGASGIPTIDNSSLFVKKTILWENASPRSPFPYQELPVYGIEKFNKIIIEVMSMASNWQQSNKRYPLVEENIVVLDDIYKENYYDSIYYVNTSRGIRYKDGKITFNYTSSADYGFIPIRIIGIEEV